MTYRYYTLLYTRSTRVRRITTTSLFTLLLLVLAGCTGAMATPNATVAGISAETAEIPIGSDTTTVIPTVIMLPTEITKSAPTETTEIVEAVETAEVVDTQQPTVTSTPLPQGDLISGEATSSPDLVAEPQIIATATPTPTSSFNQTPCEFETSFLDRGVKCGYVTVPENHADPYNGRTLDLHIAILQSDNPQPAPDPILYLAGGPGADALKTLPFVFESRFRPLLRNHDIVIFDQRGSGYSRPSLACPEYTQVQLNSLQQIFENDAKMALALSSLQACQQRLITAGVNLNMYSSRASASDAVAVMEQLEYETWNLWGVGYGTRLAQTIMRDHPTGVRSVVLDSAYPLNANLLTEAPASIARGLSLLFESCANDDTCNNAYPELERAFYGLVEQYHVQPAITQSYDPLRGKLYDVVLDSEAFVELVVQGLYSAETFASLPKLISDAQQGDLSLLNTLMASTIISHDFSSTGQKFAIQCHEEFNFVGSEQIDAASANFPQLKSFFDTNISIGKHALDVCSFWQNSTADASENVNITSNIPTLILAGERDPIAPPAAGQAVANSLNSSAFITFPTLSHNVTTDPCAQDIMRGFLQDAARPIDASCINELTTNFAVASVRIPQTLVSFDDAALNITGVVPSDWVSTGPGAYARQASAFDQTMIIQQATSDFGKAQLLTLLSTQLNIDLSNSVGNRPTGDQTWELYQSTMIRTMVDIAISEHDGVAYGVIMFSHQPERDGLYAAVFLPALDAITLK